MALLPPIFDEALDGIGDSFSDAWDWLREGVTGIFGPDGAAPDPTKPATGGTAGSGKPDMATAALLLAAGVAAGFLLTRK